MWTDFAPSARQLRIFGNVRGMAIALAFTAGVWMVSDRALSGGVRTTVLLIAGSLLVAFCAVVLWKPVVGLYSAVFFDLAMEPQIAHDPLSKYTSYFQDDLNTSLHAGIAFSPLELLLVLTGVSFVFHQLLHRKKLRGGTLGIPVMIFGLFLLWGFVYGFLTHGDVKTALFEVRGPFQLVLIYFLLCNLITTREALNRFIAALLGGGMVLAVWGIVRFIVFFHGHGGGPDGAFGSIHEDAVFLLFLVTVLFARLMLGAGSVRRNVTYLLVFVPPAIIVVLEMQRRAAFAALFFAIFVLGFALFLRNRRLFMHLAPIVIVLSLVYTAAFWHSNSKWAGPIRALRSQTASSTLNARDTSSDIYRINEMYDVRYTIMTSPVLGIGYGHPFIMIRPLPKLSWWPFQFYEPHAEIMWVWMTTGAGGFVAFLTLLSLALQRAGALIRQAGSSNGAFVCVVAAIYIVMLIVFSYVDVGLADKRTEVLLGTALGVIGMAPALLGLPVAVRKRIRTVQAASSAATVRVAAAPMKELP
ncbi:MAG: O-antigen ligase family protein [Chloroflexi bacterium]|nr:O-antigen ligase family protein [Chloroflexota bacterium]